MALKDPPRTPAATPVKSRVQPKSSGRPPEREYEGSPLSMAGLRGGVLYSTFMKVVLLLLIAIFAIGFGMQSIGTGSFGGGRTGGPATAGPDPVARVGTEEIKRDRLQQALSQQISMMEQFGQHTSAVDYLSSKQRALESLTSEGAQYQAAQQAGITVSDADIDAKINKEIDDEIKGNQGTNAGAFRRQIEQQYGSLDAYKDDVRKKIDRDKVARQLMVEKLEKKIKDANTVSEQDYKNSVTKLHLYQIVIRPKLAMPTAKDMKAAQDKNAADAKAKADKIMSELKANPALANFEAIAQKESEDVPTQKKGGEVGWKLPAEMYYSPTIKDAITKASGSLVGPLQDDVGSSKDNYIFFIAGRKLQLPKDYSKPKKKDEYIKGFKAQKDNEVWSKYQEDLKKKYPVELLDPSLAAYKTQTEDIFTAPPPQQAALRQQAVDKYKDALNYAGPMEKAAINYQLAQLYRQLNQPPLAAAALKDAVADDKRDVTLGLDYARALREEKKDADALAQLKEVSKQIDETPAPQGGMMMMGQPNQNDQMRLQVASEFDALKRQDLAAAERKKVKPPARQPGMPGGGAGGMPTINIPGGAGGGRFTIPARPGQP